MISGTMITIGISPLHERNTKISCPVNPSLECNASRTEAEIVNRTTTIGYFDLESRGDATIHVKAVGDCVFISVRIDDDGDYDVTMKPADVDAFIQALQKSADQVRQAS
jgi:hypothetical protein